MCLCPLHQTAYVSVYNVTRNLWSGLIQTFRVNRLWANNKTIRFWEPCPRHRATSWEEGGVIGKFWTPYLHSYCLTWNHQILRDNPSEWGKVYEHCCTRRYIIYKRVLTYGMAIGIFTNVIYGTVSWLWHGTAFNSSIYFRLLQQ